MRETIQDRLNELERRSAADAAEIKAIREQLAKAETPGPWVPKFCENVIMRLGDSTLIKISWDGDKRDTGYLDRGRIYPNTHAGRAQAEFDDRAEKFRASWKRAADVAPGKPGWVPILDAKAAIDGVYVVHLSIPKFSTVDRVSDWIDSEGADVVREMLTGGLW
jgi:hypothetical protein